MRMKMAEFYILSVVTQLMKSKELNCANYHPNELWLAGGPSKCTMCKTATISTPPIRSNELPQHTMQSMQSSNCIHFNLLPKNSSLQSDDTIMLFNVAISTPSMRSNELPQYCIILHNIQCR